MQTASSVYTVVFFAILGLALGSFYNVVIFRLPRGMSLARPRSRCPLCGGIISWYDNIPLLSYLLLKGRCRSCKERIPVSYPVVESASSLAAALAARYYGLTPEAFWIYAFVSILLVIAFIDWYHKIIPDILSVGGIVLGWLGSLSYLDITFYESLVGSIFGGGLLVLVAFAYRALRKIEGLGGGDIKLMAMIGAFLGWKMVFPVLFLASLMGTIYGVYLIKRGGSGKSAVAFGSFLSPAALVVLCFGERLWRIYIKLYPS